MKKHQIVSVEWNCFQELFNMCMQAGCPGGASDVAFPEWLVEYSYIFLQHLKSYSANIVGLIRSKKRKDLLCFIARFQSQLVLRPSMPPAARTDSWNPWRQSEMIKSLTPEWNPRVDVQHGSRNRSSHSATQPLSQSGWTSHSGRAAEWLSGCTKPLWQNVSVGE